MKTIRTRSARGVLLIAALVSLLTIGLLTEPEGYLDRVYRSIDLFGKVYKEIALNYVDPINPEKFMRSGIDGMLNALDPYTVFIGPEEASEVELLTTGKYGGIGITIGLRDGYVTVISLMEGYSAQRQGIREGDRILEIDGKPLKGLKLERVQALVRGEVGTEVRLKIEREGEPQPLEFVLRREEIQLKSITYAGYIEDGIAYIRLERFLRTAGDELRRTINDLESKGQIKGVILDLRNNPGGLLDVAVDVVEKFVPKGSLIVSTRGRTEESEKRYYSTQEPMLGDVPLVVLVNQNSASASEIVAGAIQDLDRGLVIGTRTFGKGLVQTITPLDYNASLKITTARYYTPSGRCIQALDYAHRSADGAVEAVPDSLRKEFKTLHGRSVFSSGGILPDSTVPTEIHSEIYNALLQKAMFFKFAVEVRARRQALPQSFTVSDSLLDAFKKFLSEQQFTYETASEIKVKELREVAAKEALDSTVFHEITRLAASIQSDKAKEFQRHAQEIRRGLLMAIVEQYGGDSARIAASLSDDYQLDVARNILRNHAVYQLLLQPKISY